MFINLVTNLFQFWITTEWYFALIMSFGVNCAIYLLSAFVIHVVSSSLNARKSICRYLDENPLKPNQIKTEKLYGIAACFIFALASLFTRLLFKNVWPESLMDFFMQMIVFSIFYEMYSYLIHRLLHLKIFRFVHAVHHRSIRVTPWSAYSVHPVEAFFIGVSAPIFMIIFPMSLSVILGLHILGMVFTMLIHSNLKFYRSAPFLNVFNGYTVGHALHHQKSNVNFGFTSSFLDVVFKTKYRSVQE